jgi:dolichol-phosphate mannosyltransferase
MEQQDLGSVRVVVPARHEVANIAELVDRVDRAFAPFPIQWRILFVDDSDDETPDVIREVGRRYRPGQVAVHHRTPAQRYGSIAGAIVEGLRKLDEDVAVVIDADLQHPPEILPAIVTPLLLGRADICVPGRYLPGGSSLGLHRRWRRAASRGSGLVCQIVFPETRRVNDPGGGLFGVRSEVLAEVDLKPVGFKSLLEVLVRGDWKVHCEFPYEFAVRHDGTSKARLRDGIPFVRHIGRLWWDTRVVARRRRVRRRRVAPVDPLVLTLDTPSSRPLAG